MNGDLYFQDVPDIDSLYMEQILFSYENIPIVFVCTDNKNFRYLCVCDDIIEEESWIIVKINNLKLLEILNDYSTVLSAFAGKKVIIAHRNFYQKPQYDIMNYSDINKDDLPVCDQFLEMKDHLNRYIDKIRNDVISFNIKLHFQAHDIFDNERNTPYSIQFILTNESICQTADYITSELCCNTGQKTLNVCDYEYSCKTTHEESGDFNNHSEETIAFAA